MGYTLEAIIGSATALRAAVPGQPGAVLVELPQNLAMVPMTDELFDTFVANRDDARPGQPPDETNLGFHLLPDGFDRVLAAWSSVAPLGYVEASYFGGMGRQRAALWTTGLMRVGPLHVEVGQPFGAAGSPISQILRELGVYRGKHRDEFDAVGLGRHRDTADWLPFARD